MKKYLDPEGSSQGGLIGFFEAVLRKSKALVHALVLIPCYGVAALCLGLAAAPGVYFTIFVWRAFANSNLMVQASMTSIAIAMGYFMYGFGMLVTVPLFYRILFLRIQPWRGTYYSWETVRWYLYNALTYLMRLTFLEFFTPTPFNILFYRLMGMKIGEGTQLNTVQISDPCLIQIGKRVTVGGSAVIIGHYGMAGRLILAPVTIGDQAVIGLRAIIMGDVEIGEGATILPNSVVLPRTRVPAGETWGGVPAKMIS